MLCWEEIAGCVFRLIRTPLNHRHRIHQRRVNYSWVIWTTNLGPKPLRLTPISADTSFQFLYAGNSVVSLSSEPQTLLVNLVRRNGLPALTGQYLVDLLPRDGSQCGMFGQEDVFVKEERQEIALMSPECLDLVPNQVLGHASAHLLRAPLSDVCHHTSAPVTAHVDQPVADTGPTSTDPMVVSASDDKRGT